MSQPGRGAAIPRHSRRHAPFSICGSGQSACGHARLANSKRGRQFQQFAPVGLRFRPLDVNMLTRQAASADVRFCLTFQEKEDEAKSCATCWLCDAQF